MSRRLHWIPALCAVLGLAAFVADEAAAAGVDLSWDECGLAGSQFKASACASNTGSPYNLVASFQPPGGITQLVGITADLRVSSIALPDWWKHGSGQCRGTSSLLTNFDFTSGPVVCRPVWSVPVFGGYTYTLGDYGPNTARLRVSAFVSDDQAAAVRPDSEYYAFRAQILADRSTGAGSCAGCSAPVALSIVRMQLFQPAAQANNPILTTALHRDTAYWQAVPIPPPAIAAFSPQCLVPAGVVTIQGHYFTGVTSVTFGPLETPAVFSVVSDSVVTATLPDDAVPGTIKLTSSYGTGSGPYNFAIGALLRATLTALPHTAPAGTVIAVFGRGMVSVTGVTVGGIGATFNASSDSVLHVTVPAAAATGRIVVTSCSGNDTTDAFHIGPLSEGFLNLAWDDCGTAGTALKTFACDSNAPTFPLIVSFVPPLDVNRLGGIAADLRLQSGQVPDWWKFGAGLCRGALAPAVNLAFTGPPASCANPWNSVPSVTTSYDLGYYGPNTARLHVFASFNSVTSRAVSPDSEYYGLRVLVDASHTTGVGACDGCDVPQSLTLDGLQLFQLAEYGYDPMIEAPKNRNTVYWQGTPGPPPTLTSITPAAGPVGSTVRLSGARLATTHDVRFNGTAATFGVTGDTLVTATVPAGARTGTVLVLTHYGSAIAPLIFVLPPHIASFIPAQAPIGFDVLVTGTDFTSTSAVSFGGVAASFQALSDVELSTSVPLGAHNGPIIVTNAAGSDTSRTDFIVSSFTNGGGINLSWGDCGTFGLHNTSFACNSNLGTPFVLIGSFTPPPGISNFLGINAQVDITTDQATLPDWWRHGAGQCRGTTGLSSGFDFTVGPFSCTDFYAGMAAGGFAYDVAFGSPARARLRLTCAVPIDNRGPVDPSVEYYAFKVNLLRAKTTGAGNCAGCANQACIVLNNIQLFQTPEAQFDPVVSNPQYSNFVTWQGQPASCPMSTAVQVAVVSGDALAGVVHVVWSVNGFDHATIERREGAGNWLPLDVRIPDGTHHVSYDDAAVRAGVTYSYRLGLPVPEGEVYQGEVSITVPATAELSLGPVIVGGNAATLAFTLTLPAAGPATVDVFDATGRRCAGQHLDRMAAGAHAVSLRPANPLAAGMYFARVRAGSGQVSRRFVVLR